MNDKTLLRADEEWFSARAKDLIAANSPFQFVVSGEQAEQLRQFLVDGRLHNMHRMAVNRLVRPIMAVALIAEGAGRPVRFTQREDDIVGMVFGLVS